MTPYQRWCMYSQEIGCAACNQEYRYAVTNPGDMHHCIDLGPRDDRRTICLCPWHHRGVKPQQRGPSLAKNPEAFFEKYVSEWALFAQHRNDVLRYMCEHELDSKIIQIVRWQYG